MYYSDELSKLPYDRNNPINKDDMQIVNEIFQSNENASNVKNVLSEFKDHIYYGIIFSILSTSKVDELLRDYVNINNGVFLKIVKFLIFVLITWILKQSLLT